MRAPPRARAVALAALLVLGPSLLGGSAASSEADAAPWGGFLRYGDRVHGEHLSTALTGGNLTPLLAGREGGVLLAGVTGGNLTTITVHPNGTATATGDALNVTLHDTPQRTLVARASGPATLRLELTPGAEVELRDAAATLQAGPRVGVLHPDGNATLGMENGTLAVTLGPGGGATLTWYASGDPLLPLALQGLHAADVRSTGAATATWALNGTALAGAPAYDGVNWTATLPASNAPRLVTVAVAGLLQGEPRVLLGGVELERANATHLHPDAPGRFALLGLEPTTLAVLLPAATTNGNLTILLDGEPPRIVDATLVNVTSTTAHLSIRLHELAHLRVSVMQEGDSAIVAEPPGPARRYLVALPGLTQGAAYRTAFHVTDLHGNAAIVQGPQFRTLPPPTPEDPIILNVLPAHGAAVPANAEVGADYEDPTRTLPHTGHVHLRLDGINVTANATADERGIRYAPEHGLTPGEHHAELRLRNADGGEARAYWTFHVEAPATPARGAPGLALPAALTLLAAAVIFAGARYRR